MVLMIFLCVCLIRCMGLGSQDRKPFISYYKFVFSSKMKQLCAALRLKQLSELLVNHI